MGYEKNHQAVLNNCGTVYKLDLRDKDTPFREIHVDIAAVELRRIFEAFYDSLPAGKKEKLTEPYNKLRNAIADRTGKFAVLCKPVLNVDVLKENNDYYPS